jgi:hypothetical protein
MIDKNCIAFNKDAKRVKVLKEMRVVNGKITSFEKYLRDYLRSMAFLYRETGNSASKYRVAMEACTSMATAQWQTFKEAS